MDKRIVVIGNGKIAKTISTFPGVFGYVNINDMTRILDPNNSRFIEEVNSSKHVGVIGIGKTIYKKTNAEQWKNIGCDLGILIHPTAFVDTRAKIGLGSVIWPLAYIDDGSVIGECTTIGPQSGVRGGTIGNYCHLTIQNKILPNATVGDFVFMGAGATILERVVVGECSVITANSTVKGDVPERTFYYEKREGKTKIIPEGVYYPLTDAEKLAKNS